MKSVDSAPDIPAFFKEAEKDVENYFKDLDMNSDNGTINIHGKRYILVRAESMSIKFLEFIKNKYPAFDDEDAYSAAQIFLYDMAHSLGKSDANNFHHNMNIKNKSEKMAIGPLSAAFTGWAKVKVFSDSKPILNNEFYLVYDLLNSFEADSWVSLNKKNSKPVCFMNAGYSAGWCEESSGVRLVTREVLCRAKGDQFCRFIMAHPDEIDRKVEEYKKKHIDLFD